MHERIVAFQEPMCAASLWLERLRLRTTPKFIQGCMEWQKIY